MTWDEIIALLDRHGGFWETRDRAHTPWPDDPDGGELRIAVALRRLAAAAAHLGPDAAISTERLRSYLTQHLTPGTAPPCCPPAHPCEPGYAQPTTTTTEKR